ncbi:hypothetical protein CEXT_336601 [Caerostris extrusa]|uniref:Uncharacterized protein n=1 Tax=Caerostris extrusa TaxID=172846 RepID=A0AAV4Y198_CAEEX|nr:hypothetical protein CEXT_336601 [Caerostris extrusa]
MKTFSDSEFVKECLEAIVKDILPDKLDKEDKVLYLFFNGFGADMFSVNKRITVKKDLNGDGPIGFLGRAPNTSLHSGCPPKKKKTLLDFVQTYSQDFILVRKRHQTVIQEKRLLVTRSYS